ncbi:MAG: EamA family transporter [Proteobacteria bacterium]|nr:EamA family transporter [Pseudomonadota bacterium]
MQTAMMFALAAMACFGFADFYYKRAAAAGAPAHHFIFTQSLYFGPLIVLYALATGRLILAAPALWGLLAGAFMFVGFYNFAASLRSGAVSVIAPVFRLNFVITAFAAIALLGERLTLIKAAGLACALAAVWLLLANGQGASARRLDRKTLAQVVLATFAVAAANLCHKYGLRAGANVETLLVAQATAVNTLAPLVVYARDRRFRFTQYQWTYPAITAVLLLLGFLALLQSLVTGEVSVYVPVAQLGFIVTAAAGVVILGEPLTARKIMGLLFAVGALIAFAVS